MATRFGANKSDVKNTVFVLWLFGALVFAGASALAATTYTWQKTTGGEMTDGANWSPAGLPADAANAALTISKGQSAPITLASDLSCLGGKHYFSFTGDIACASPTTTLTLGGGNLYLNGNGCTTRFTCGTLVNNSWCYFENGAQATRFILSGSDVSAVFKGGVVVGSWQQNKSFEVENGAQVTLTNVTVGRDDNGGSNDTFRVTGRGTVAKLSETLAIYNGGNNVAEISDGAELSVKEIRIGSWYKRDNTLVLTNVFNTGNKVRVDGGRVTVKGGPVTVGYHTCSNALEVVNGGLFTVVSNVFNLGSTRDIGQTSTGSVPYNFPGLAYRLNGNRVLISGAGSVLKLDCGGNQGFWLGRGIGDDARVDVENGGRWESTGEFKLGDGACTNGLVRVGPGGCLTHGVYGVSIGISSNSSQMGVQFDGGTGDVRTVTVTVGQGGKNCFLDVKNDGRLFGRNLVVGSGAAGSNNVVRVTSGGLAEFSGYVSIGTVGTASALWVDGGTFIATNDATKAAVSNGGTGSRLVVCGGGTARFKTVYWGDQGSSANNCSVVVSNGTLTASGSLQIGGSDDTVAHGCAMTVAGADTDVCISETLGIQRDSELAFEVPQDGFAATPVKVKSLAFGTRCATRPTLKVRCSEKNQAKYVTLVEATNDIAIPNDLNLDLPTGARLLTSDDPRYDAKKLTVKLPVARGLLVIFR